MLFKNAPDLMEEFRDFLPEAMGHGSLHAGLIGIMPHPTAGPPPSSTWDQGTETPPANAEKPKAPRRRKRGPEKETPVVQKVATGRVSGIPFITRSPPMAESY